MCISFIISVIEITRISFISDLWQTRKRAGVWESAESQPKKRLRPVLVQSAQSQQHTEGQPEAGRPAAHGKQAVLSQLQGLSIVPL